MIRAQAEAAKAAARVLATASTETKHRALSRIVEGLERREAEILEANRANVEEAQRDGLAPALLDRLALTPKRIQEMVAGVREVMALPDPVGEMTRMSRRPTGLLVGRMRVPIGLLGVIYESRPNVTVDVSALCLKSGNAVLLRGGSEALRSNTCLARILQDAIQEAGLPPAAVSLIEQPGHESALELMRCDDFVDLLIPRGGEALMRLVTEHSRIPVIRHDKGVCHVYVDEAADLALADAIAYNAKVQRPATCNAMETLLVHRAEAPRFLPALASRLRAAGVELRVCPETLTILPEAKPATEDDWRTEYLDLILAIRVVAGLEEAMAHIAAYGSQHTDAIVTRDHQRAMRFVQEVDSSCVLVNASTRLNDGYQLGLGAELGISTMRIHARGPMGLEELTCSKFIALGEGHLRS